MLIGYARVSTDDQDPSLQRDALTAAGCERIFVEQASGAQRARPQLTAALEYVRPGDVIVIWKLDRLARSLKQLIETVELTEGKKVGLRSLTEDIDTTSPSGRLVFHIFGALAEFERALIRERTIAGLESARARGKFGGRPRSLSQTDLYVAKALLSDAALTAAQVAGQLGVSVSTLYNYFPAARSEARF